MCDRLEPVARERQMSNSWEENGKVTRITGRGWCQLRDEFEGDELFAARE